jgi:hypothetical protein
MAWIDPNRKKEPARPSGPPRRLPPTPPESVKDPDYQKWIKGIPRWKPLPKPVFHGRACEDCRNWSECLPKVGSMYTRSDWCHNPELGPDFPGGGQPEPPPSPPSP